MILSNSEKEAVIDYLKTCRKASQTGKYEMIQNLSSDEKQEMAKIFSRLRNQGILCYLKRNDELLLKKITPFNLDYEWDLTEIPERPEFDEKKCTKICKACEQLDFCAIRMREWKRLVDTIGNKRRIHPEGHIMAEEAIKYMKHDFMGGM